MKISNFFRMFQPKDKVFFVLFEKISGNLIEMSKEFLEQLDEDKYINPNLLESMKAFEKKNDDLTHEVYMELNQNFITPFDREDIHQLASTLDDIADYIYATTEYIVLYKTPYEKAYTQFAKMIYDATLELQTAIIHLKDFTNSTEVKDACIKVNSLENQADRLFSKSMVELFETNDAIRVIKTSAVLENLEIATDKAEEVANIIQGVMIKYS